MIRIFIGYDSREAVAFSVLAFSIFSRASAPVSITPLAAANLRTVLWRERDPLQSTEFAFSRFLTPYLSGYEGWSLFLDCDMLVLEDVAELWRLRDERCAVQVVKHDHRPRETVKFLGQPQTAYAKKNWSSVMLMNNARLRALTPEYVNRASGLELHQFKWLGNDSLIGELPRRWNHLVGYDPPTESAALLHFTLGGPYFEDYAAGEHADLWRAEYARMCSVGRARAPGRDVPEKAVGEGFLSG